MADFNLKAMSFKELRQLQKDLAKAISTYRTGTTAKPPPSWKPSLRRWATLWPN